MQVTISFVAGLMLGVGLLHMVPHSIHGTGSADRSMFWLAAGLLTTFFLIRVFQFHQHAAEDDEAHDHHANREVSARDSFAAESKPLPVFQTTRPLDHEHACSHHHHAATAIRPHELSWLGVAIGLALHSALDGVAVAASVLVEARGGGAYLFGLGTLLGVLLHKPLDALSITSLMAAAGWPSRMRQTVNVGFALMCPLGAAGFYFGLSGLADSQHDLTVGCALAFSAGVFLCIALSDLLPELQFHKHDRMKLSVALLLGVALAWCVGFLEPKHAHPSRNAEFGVRGASDPSDRASIRNPQSAIRNPTSDAGR
jgi:zinc and cadmium transporter